MADGDLYTALGITPQKGDLYQALGIQPKASQGPINTTGFVDDALHAGTGGLSDKMDALLQTMGAADGGVQEGSFSDRYHKNLTNVRNKYQDYEAENPGWAGAKGAQAVGVVAPMLVVGPAEAASKTLLEASGKAAKAGAVAGGAYGFGGTDDSSLKQDVEATGAGAITGAAMGGTAPTAMGIAASPFRIGGRAASIFGKTGLETAAGRVIGDAATGAPTFDKAPLPGMSLTSGQSSNDPGLLWLERNVSQATPKGAQLSADSAAKNNTAITGAVGQLSDQNTDASKAMSDALDAAYAKRKAANSALWTQADVSNTGGVSGFQFNNYIKKYVAALPVADQAAVPPDIMAVMDKMAAAKTQNLSDVQSVRSMLGSRATMASRAGDTNTARILNGLSDQVESFVDMKAQNLGAKFPLYNQARADTRDLKQTFNQPPAVRAALGVDSQGADRVPVSATADHFINSSKGAPETFNSYLNAIATKDPTTGKLTYDPAGMKAAQDAFAQKFLGTVINTGTDQNGTRLISPAKMQKFMDDYSHVINSPLYTQPQRDLMGRIAKATQMASRTASSRPPGGGSDTFQKLQGDKFIDTLIGPGASKLINVGSTAAGALLGSAHGPVEAVAGAFGGGKVGDMVSSLFSAPREKAINLITEAMHDPQLAQDLMMKASNSNAKLLPPPRRAKILGILGAQAAPSAAQALTGP